MPPNNQQGIPVLPIDNKKDTSSLVAAFVLTLVIAAFWVASFNVLPKFFVTTYTPEESLEAKVQVQGAIHAASTTPVVAHVKTPEQVKAIYMTSWVAGTKHLRERLIKLIDETELNAIVIDVKDYTGKISFPMDNAQVKELGSVEKRIADIGTLIDELHRKNIYVIARVSVFQDVHLAQKWPQFAVQRKSDGKTWADRKGLMWMDASSFEVWDYNLNIAKEAYKVGFDEINFDYIRFPSDGDISQMVFPVSKDLPKDQVMESFFAYVHQEMGNAKIPTSADLFGMTTTATDDMNIGQVLEVGLRYFDFVAPMVYPSHYPKGFSGMKNPAEKPYETIHEVMTSAVERANAIGVDPQKLRPWLQDFNLGAVYTSDLVRAQMTATYDVGLTSWMLWDPNNRYTRDALDKQDNSIVE